MHIAQAPMQTASRPCMIAQQSLARSSERPRFTMKSSATRQGLINASSSTDISTDTTKKSLPPTFHRLVARTTGTSFTEVAEVEETPMLVPGEGEVLIRVRRAGINGGCETFRARGEHAFARNKEASLFTLGAEGVGVVECVGTGVDTLKRGQSVTFIGGAFSEYVVAKASLCWSVPEPSRETVALTISGTVAAAALTHVGRMQPGETVLVTAAGGATGHFAAQLAHLGGCRVVATCGGEKKAARLRALGLHRVIDHTKEDISKVLQTEFHNQIDVAYEGVGGHLQQAAWESLAPGGRMLVVGYISEYPHTNTLNDSNSSDSNNSERETDRQHQNESTTENRGKLPPSAELFWGGRTIEMDGRTAYGSVWPSERKDTLEAKARVFKLYEAGQLQAWVDERRFSGVASVPSAVEYMLQGKAVGKVVVDFD